VVMISSQDFELNFFNLSSLLFNFQVAIKFHPFCSRRKIYTKQKARKDV
jgi:hypothetical protein